jgi:elongation factor G
MRVYESEAIRNVGLAGHGHSGKTTLAAAMLHTAGATARLLRPDDGNTVTDFDEEEIQRHMTISTGIAVAEYKDRKINLLDTPGFNAFLHDTHAALMAADAELIVIDGVAGVEVSTEAVWKFADEFTLPAAFVVNKLDRERADFERALESIRGLAGRGAISLQLPLGQEKDFKGIVDLVVMKAYRYDADGNGRGVEIPIPADLAGLAQAGHEALVEIIAEGNDALMEEFFETGTLPEEHLQQGILEAVKQRRLFPVFATCAMHNIGTDRLLDFVADYFPAPVEHPPLHAHQGELAVDEPIRDNGHPSAYVFKTMADQYAGRVSFFKVVHGPIKSDAHLENARSHADERLAHIGSPMGKQILPVTELHAGDIGAVAKLKDTLTGDTLHEKTDPTTIDPVAMPEPSIAYAIKAKSRQDEDRIGQAMQKMMEEDPALRFYRDPATNEFLIAGNGQQHVEVVVSRLRRRYSIDVQLSAPKVPYRETITKKAEVQGRHKKQTGGHGQFGDCWIRIEPLERGTGFEFGEQIFGGSIPRQFVPAIEKGIREAATVGPITGSPVIDFRVTVYDGSYHDVDSNEMSFKVAGRKAFRAAMQVCRPVLLEPVMKVEVTAPQEYGGDLMGDINGRRGRVQGMDVKGSNQVIQALVPMAEMLSYQTDLTSKTQGRGSFTMSMSHYDVVPAHLADKLAAAAKANLKQTDEDE